MRTEKKDVNSLKTIADEIVNEMKEGLVFFANVKEDDSVNFISRSTCKVNSGVIVKEAALASNGNGGGSPTFAQGAGKNSKQLDKIFEKIEKEFKNE